MDASMMNTVVAPHTLNDCAVRAPAVSARHKQQSRHLADPTYRGATPLSHSRTYRNDPVRSRGTTHTIHACTCNRLIWPRMAPTAIGRTAGAVVLLIGSTVRQTLPHGDSCRCDRSGYLVYRLGNVARSSCPLCFTPLARPRL